MRTLIKLLASILAFLTAFTMVVTFLSEKAKEHKYIVIDDDGNELF
ncbi:MAG: hypothetical protein IKU54_04830 [Oscillospiraceae bacterium]|nr:hypothetical protein [Oscillospiraceae bacterium]